MTSSSIYDNSECPRSLQENQNWKRNVWYQMWYLIVFQQTFLSPLCNDHEVRWCESVVKLFIFTICINMGNCSLRNKHRCYMYQMKHFVTARWWIINVVLLEALYACFRSKYTVNTMHLLTINCINWLGVQTSSHVCLSNMAGRQRVSASVYRYI